MTWYTDSDDRTWWYCSECKEEIEEDESKECGCGLCGFPSVSWLIEEGEGYYWCFNCNRKTDKTIYQENFHEKLGESMKQVIEELKKRAEPGNHGTD
jgi:hypothetical protein